MSCGLSSDRRIIQVLQIGYVKTLYVGFCLDGGLKLSFLEVAMSSIGYVD
jgi:hypothetical protein